MAHGIKNTASESEVKYSSMTTEEKLQFHKKVLQDGLNFSKNFSHVSFINYNNLKMANTIYRKELQKATKYLDATKFDEEKKKKLLKLARNPDKSYELPLNMYSDQEIKFFKTCIMPYVQREYIAKQTQKNLFISYQDYVIYKDISELWMVELDMFNKSMILENYRKKIDSLEDLEDTYENKKEAKKSNIEKLQRRIKMHIAKNQNIDIEKENKEEIYQEHEKVQKSKVNFDDWL